MIHRATQEEVEIVAAEPPAPAVLADAESPAALPETELPAILSEAEFPAAEVSRPQVSFHAGQSGDWMPVEELREAALGGLRRQADLCILLDGLDHLDTSAFQVLLALSAEQKNQDRKLALEGASPALREWFALAGAEEILAPPPTDSPSMDAPPMEATAAVDAGEWMAQSRAEADSDGG